MSSSESWWHRAAARTSADFAGADKPLIGWEAGLVRLTNDGRFKRNPVFWPNGEELIYAEVTPVTQLDVRVDGPEGRLRLMRMRWTDRTVSRFHGNLDDKRLSDRELCVSADGNVYAYCLQKNVLATPIVVEDLKQRRTATIEYVVAAALTYFTCPTLSPDGSRIAYTRGACRLVTRDPWQHGGPEVELGVDGDHRPSFSPDGRRIVFTSRRDRDFEIYVMNADGSKPCRLTRSRGIDTNAVFSPDGRRIAFTSNRDGNYEIYVMDDDGRNQQRVTRSSERSDFPCWHPDGKRLVFVGERNGRFDLYIMEAPTY